MNKRKKYKNKILKRVLSVTLTIALVFSGLPSFVIPKEVEEYVGIESNVMAAPELTEEELAALTSGHSSNTYSFTSGGPELSEYSQCFQDSTWAAYHTNDTLTLNPVDDKFVFDSNYNPIGSESAPFSGTIIYNTTASDFAVEARGPIFNYVSDSVKLMRLTDNENIPININRVADADSTVSPLFAKHIVGSGLEAPKEWKVTLNSASVCSYSGVIYEMTSGAKISLTFTDNSSHTPTEDANGNIISGSIIDNKESNKNYGILCGKISGSSVLIATYTKTNDDDVTFIGTETAYTGGLIGEINSSTFELLIGSSSTKVDFQTKKDQVGFICGHSESSTITLPAGYTFSGSIDGKVYAGGIAGYCKNTTVNYLSAEGAITLSNCEVKNGTTTGGVFGYYECDTFANDILIDRTYTLSDCTVEGTGVSGGVAGEYKPTYSGAVTIDLEKYTLGDSITLNTGKTAGGLFGKYTAPGSVTITDSDRTNTHFAPPASSVAYGGIIGEYVNSSYSNTLLLSGFTVNGLNASSSENVGGIIRVLSGSTYVSVSGVSVTNASVSNATPFGGIISTLNSNNEGSFIDITGNFTLSLASGTTYKGGAIAGSFKKGVVRFASITDISGAQAANGYAQLIYENDETLVYAKGSGSDANWTLKRNAATTASDLGQWGEVVRLFKVDDVYKNAEDAGIVSMANNKVTVAQGVTSITDIVSFAKCALNMQLNDGSDHGALCFADKTTYTKSALLGSDLTVNGTIDLSGTGMLGFMRDGGKAFSSADYFTGSISKASEVSTASIKLNTGEAYGTYPENETGTGGKIYVSNSYGHNSQGLFAFAKGASATNLTVSGDVKYERNAGESTIYAGALFGAMTNGATLSGVTITTTLDITKADNAFAFIGGVAGVFEGSETANNPYKLDIKESCSIEPTIKLYGNIGYTESKTSTNVGGILGSLKGDDATVYNVSIKNSEVSPRIEIGTEVADVDISYVGGMIGRIAENTTNARTVILDTVSMTGASVETKSKYSGGLLGSHWERTNLTVDGLTIIGSVVNSKYSGAGSKQSGLVFKGTGKWDINTLTIKATSDSTPVNTEFKSTDSAPVSFGLIVNEAYSGNAGLYINLKNSGYTLNGVTVPTSSSNTNYYIDEIAADTCSGDLLAGGNGTAIVNINMNAVVNNVEGTATKITDIDSNSVENGTGTYQNRLGIGNRIANQNSRYYYNLDVMMKTGHTKTDGEKFLLWSVNQYAASNIKTNFAGAITGITNIDLSGLSYYPIPGGDVTLPTDATITFGFKAINDYENRTITPDGWSRNPDDVGNPNSTNARNQHYLMQTGLFTTVTSLTANTLTLTGDFGYVSGVASGALINDSTSGKVSLTALTLNGLKPSNADSYLLINYIDGTGENARPELYVSNLRASDYSNGLPVAKSLFGKAQGQNMTINFSDIKLDARDGNTITDTNWLENAATNAESMTNTYGTSRSIFSTAIFFNELLAAKTSTMEYYYTVDEDWGYVDTNDTSLGYKRAVTYGKEVTDSREYNSGDGEKKYNIVGSGDRHYTNPVGDNNAEFNFSAGFLPYVGNYTSKGTNATYPVNEIKVNYKVDGLVDGCGTYNDPYIISTAAQLNLVANAINTGETPGTIKLPNTMSVESGLPFAETWHTGANGDGLYNLSGSDYVKDESNSSGLTTWTSALVRNYLASAYYVITADLTGTNSLPSGFNGIGKPGSAVNGSIVFHGVIVGKKSDGTTPTITNPTVNPLIYISNGAVVKNLNINVTATFTKTLGRYGDNALYGYKPNDNTYKGAEYYGGVIGEIMGGDNIIDDVTVTYSGKITLNGNYKHLIAEGGMVGCVVNGALIFRGSNSVSGRSVTGGGIYSNQYVGRVINGYAVYEKISTRTKATDVAPDNYNTCVVDEEDESKVTKTYTYPIDTIDRSKTTNSDNLLDVNYTSSGTGTITVPDAQSLYIMSLITQSIASTADTSGNNNYGAYSPSYGYNSYITGVARLGDYTDVGCGISADKPSDYSGYACKDSVNNKYSTADDLLNAPVPYIIYRYTKAYGTDTVASKNYPARKMTSDNTKFWDITLSSNGDFSGFDSFQAFRGIGCVGINAYRSNNDASKTAMKVATFNGSGKTLNLHICLPRYERDKENYFHKQNKSLTQSYSGEDLHYNSAGTKTPYGHDDNLNKLMGLGLFDCVMVNNDSTHEYQFQDIKLQGTIEDKVFNTSGIDITGTTDLTQLFCVGGVVGKRIFGNDSDLNFSGIIFDGFKITGSYSCGGLIGIDSIGKKGVSSDSVDNKAKKSMRIDGCNSTANGISITGGYYGYDNNLRHGIGGFVGMTFWCRPYIDGGTNTSEISVSNISSYYTGSDNRCAVAGLIGYSGSGAEIKNIKLKGLGINPVIGASTVANAAGFIGFSQATDQTGPTTSNYLNESVNIENCTLNNISVKALNNAAGFLARCGNTTPSWYPKYVRISNCAIIGNPTNRPEIKAYGPNTNSRYGAGGFVADLSTNEKTNVSTTPSLTSVIENSYIENYLIEGNNAGGIIGGVTTRPIYLRNLYVKNCDINTYNTNAGGIVGYSEQNLSGYNLKIDGVNFGKHDKSKEEITDYTGSSGIIVGKNNSSLVDKFVGIGAYHTTASKVPTLVVKTNGTNTGNFFVFADYLNTSAVDTASTSHASNFNYGSTTVDQPVAPFLTVNPRAGIGTNEYITGDGACAGKAGMIYKEAKAGSSNRRYIIGTTADNSFDSTEETDTAVLAKYINNDGSYTDGAFKITSASAKFRSDFPTGMDDFAMLVINDDNANVNDITPFIKSYIRLVTNAACNPNTSNGNNDPIFSQYAYSITDNSTISNLYQIVISPCYYDENQGKFVLGTAGAQGLQSVKNSGKYTFDSSKADSESSNSCQFSLIDVQFKDPTDTTKIAYHLYVPVYTEKMLTAKFSAVSMSETKYYRSPYASRIASELTSGRSTSNPSQLVESTNEWTTTFIRYTYPKNQVSSDADWNYDKSIEIKLESNFNPLPDGTKLILVDPNANVDKFYILELDGSWTTGTPITLNLSDFRDKENNPFAPQSLKRIYAAPGATGTENGKAVLYEDYYISMYVPKVGDGNTHGVLFASGNEMSHTVGSDVYKANIEPKLYSLVVLGDLFEHHITSYSVASGDGITFDDNQEMTGTNNVIKTYVTATVQIKNQSAGSYLANSNVYHSFFLTLTSHDEDHKVSDIIYGITPGYIRNKTSYSYTDSSGYHSSGDIENNSTLGANYIELDTGSIIDALYDPLTRPVLTIESETSMTFNDVTAFPYNASGDPNAKIGTQVSIKSSLAYRTEDLRFSALNVLEEDGEGKFYYSTTQNSANLTFNAVPTDDVTDEIGLKTNNKNLLGVNGKYGTRHPVIGKAMYNVDDIVDYESATHVQYTIELYKKVTDVSGTRYVQVDDIADYMDSVNMSDTKVTLLPDRTDPKKYVFTGEIDHDNQFDNEKMFEATFSCIVLTGDAIHKEYANYKIQLTAQLIGPSNSWKDAYLIYTNAKIDPSVIDEQSP